MTVSPAPVIFWAAFFLLLTLCGQIHFHGFRGLGASLIGALLFTLLTRPWWRRQGRGNIARSRESFRDPALGNRARRRAEQRRYRAR